MSLVSAKLIKLINFLIYNKTNSMKRLSLLLSTMAWGLTMLMTSCAQMDTDLEPCPSGLDVSFKYNYNIQRADMFNDHVGGMSLYVFDKDNRFVLRKDTANSELNAPLKNKDFIWHLTEDELPAGKYHLVTLAFQKDYNKALNTPGIKFRPTELNKGDDITKLTVRLDRNEANHEAGYALVDNQHCPLDTLWATRGIDTNATWVTTVPNQLTHHQLNLVRDTKQLNISLRQTVDPADMNDEDYEVEVYDTNGKLLYNNELDATDSRLLYTPYAQWTTALSTRAEGAGDAQLMHTAHFELMTNRIVKHTEATDDAQLIITNKRTGAQVAKINLPAILADGRRAYELYNYSPQEYLDREYQFSLDFFLSGDKWQYINVTIAALSWAYRVQNVEL